MQLITFEKNRNTFYRDTDLCKNTRQINCRTKNRSKRISIGIANLNYIAQFPFLYILIRYTYKYGSRVLIKPVKRLHF